MHWILRGGLALLMAAAACHKARAPRAFTASVRDYRVLPTVLAPVATAGVVALEVILVVALLSPGTGLGAATACAALIAVYSLAIARLLGGLPHTAARNRGALVALVWNVGLILGGMTSWWVMWRFNEVAWSPLGFVWFVATPGLIYLQAAVLLTDDPSQIVSWKSHYLEVRRRFFAIAIARAFHSALLPWVVGAFDWFTPAPVHAGAALVLSVGLAGLWSTSLRVHLALGSIVVVTVFLFLFFTPSQIGAAA